MSLQEKSIAFGMSNFLFVQSDSSDGTYNYYGFVTKKNAVLIMRTNKTTTAALYWLGTGTFSTIWAARATKTYVTPDNLEFPRV